MVDVQIEIGGIILYCDESLKDVELGNGYNIEKCCIDDLSYRERIINSNGSLSINYMGSRLCENDKIYFMCLQKIDTYKIQPPQIKPGVTITDKDTMCTDQLVVYKDLELTHLRKQFSLLRLFKTGNIGYKEIFFTNKFTIMGFIKNTNNLISDNIECNIIDTEKYVLSTTEVQACNCFLQNYSGKEYDLLKDCIDEFIGGLEEIDIATSFEQYTTTLEMILLAKDQQQKKQVLSKRVAVLLGSSPSEIGALYDKMKKFYRYRSESLHEGKGEKITKSDLKDLEEITRSVICKYLEFCKQQLQTNSNTTWKDIKTIKISDLKCDVKLAIKNGLLPKSEKSIAYYIKRFIKKFVKA